MRSFLNLIFNNRPVSLKVKVILPVIVMSILVYIAQSHFLKEIMEDKIETFSLSEGRTIIDGVSTALQPVLVEKNLNSIKGILKDFQTSRDIEYIFIANELNQIAYHSFDGEVPEDLIRKAKEQNISAQISITKDLWKGNEYLHFEKSISGGLLGRVHLGMNMTKAKNEKVLPFLIKAMGVQAFLFSSAVLLIIGMVFKFVYPIEQLTRATQNIINTGNLNVHVPVYSKDEIGKLSRVFNQLLEKLKKERENLEQNVEDRAKLIEKQQMELAETSRLSALGEMAAGIAHEINNPLAIISSSTKAIQVAQRRGELSDRHLETNIKDIFETIKRAEKIILGLRNISRESEGEEYQLVYLKNILEDVTSLCTEKFRHRGIGFLVEKRTKTNVKVLCNQVQISQVLINLLNNAADAVEEQKEKWIKIILDQEENCVILKVVDSGKGIPVSEHKKIFRPFYTSKDVGKGTGIGLSISKKIMENHKGKIYLDDKSKNTTFVMRFPYESVEGAA